MTENIETEIRKALDAKAHEVEVPADLATRTLEIAREHERLGAGGGFQSWRDARRMHARVTGYPRWMYVGAAAAAAVLMFALGAIVTTNGGPIAALKREIHTNLFSGTTSNGQVQQSGGSTSADSNTQSSGGTAKTFGGEAGSGSSESAGASGGGGSGVVSIPPAPSIGKFPPKVVRTADIEVEVKHFDSAWSKATDIAGRYNGFVTNSSTEQVRGKLGRGTLTMRVPAVKLDAALKDLRSLGVLARLQTSGQDISGQVADVKAQLTAAEAEEAQLLDLLRNAGSVSDTIAIRSRLTEVQSQIQSAKSQQDYYNDQIDYATINATVYEKGTGNAGNGNPTTLQHAWHTAFRVGVTFVAGMLVVLGGLLPLAALGVLVWLIARTIRRRPT